MVAQFVFINSYRNQITQVLCAILFNVMWHLTWIYLRKYSHVFLQTFNFIFKWHTKIGSKFRLVYRYWLNSVCLTLRLNRLKPTNTLRKISFTFNQVVSVCHFRAIYACTCNFRLHWQHKNRMEEHTVISVVLLHSVARAKKSQRKCCENGTKEKTDWFIVSENWWAKAVACNIASFLIRFFIWIINYENVRFFDLLLQFCVEQVLNAILLKFECDCGINIFVVVVQMLSPIRATKRSTNSVSTGWRCFPTAQTSSWSGSSLQS